MDVSVIIVNWKSQEHLRKCLASIAAHTADLEYEIVVIDSASFDGCDRMLREYYPNVRFVQSTTNLGFAKANNRAFLDSIGEYVLFLNPDTELAGPAVQALRARLLSLPRAGLVGCKLLNSDGTVQSSCIQSMPTILNQLLDSEFLRKKWPQSHLWGTAPLHEEGLDPREVEAIAGACVMVKRTTFEQVGQFSEDYFMYAEDMDLSYKIRKAGFKNYYVPGVSVIHYGGSSSDQIVSTFSAVMMPEAICRFLRNTRGRAYGRGYRSAMCASAVARLLLLGLVSPFRLGDRRCTLWKASSHKWMAVLRWSLKRDDLVKEFYGRR